MVRTFRHASLQQSVQFLPGVGPQRAKWLEKLGITSVGQLLFHFPRSYDDLSDIRGLHQLEAGVLQTVTGEVVELGGKELDDVRQIISVVIADAKGRART